MTTVILLLALTTVPPQADCTPEFAPLQTGSHSAVSPLPFWRKEEAGDWDGEGWLGWTSTGDTLQPVRFIVRDLPKARVHHDEELVSVETTADVQYAVRCIPSVRAGRVENALLADDFLDPNRPVTIVLGSGRYELRLQSDRADLYDAQVILTHGDRTQVLYSADGFADEPHFIVEWAGDLDQDGKLDLIVNFHRKYSWHPHRLLLSSTAAATQLVGDAAVFETGD